MRVAAERQGMLRRPVAGVDVRGDGTFMPYRGGVGGRSSTRPSTRRRSTWSARLWKRDDARAEIPKGSYAAGRRVKLPAGAEAPYAVFINGVEQREGADYELRDGEIVFTRQIVKEKLGTGRWLAMYLGLFGTYRKNETIDLQFQRGGKTELLSDLPVEAE